MGAALDLQSAAIAALDRTGVFAGVYNDAPARAAFPYAVLTCSDEKDVRCAGRAGRELILEIAIWDEQPARLLDLEDHSELQPSMLVSVPGWQLGSLVLLGKKRTRNPVGPWSCTFSYRTRLFAATTGSSA